MKSSFKRRGFTLVELLVVITMIVVLAGVVFTLTRRIRDKAAASKSLSDIRQAGTILLAKASETNGRCQYFSGSNGAFDFRPYFIIRNELGIDLKQSNGVIEIMHWDGGREVIQKKSNAHWNCRAVNFTNVPDFNAVWTTVSTPNADGTSANISSLTIASVTRPSLYPLLIDSSSFSGSEIFRINQNNGDCVGLRSNGKANALMLDGSGRAMDKADLKASGFKKAYDNSTTPPKSITL
jgi:prepilin-type N-terminal cleavage/methylation domain-containing protein/prepilin-type processing-associated H-X9-DG protein